MARLTWDQVQAPNLDTRDIALAGQTIGNSFDRLGQMLKDRYLEKKKEATSAAIAAQLAINDPAALAANFDVNTIDKNADPASVLMARSQHYSEVMQQQNAHEDLLNKQAATALGPQMFDLLVQAHNGNVDAGKTLQANALADPDKIGRALAQLSPQLYGAFAQGEQHREEVRVHDANIADAAQGRALQGAGLALQREQIASARADRLAVLQGGSVGDAQAHALADLSTPRALDQYTQSKAYTDLPALEKPAALQNFAAMHPQYHAAATERRAETTPPLVSIPGLDELVARSAQISADKTYDRSKLQDLIPPTEVTALLSKHPQNTAADIDAILSTRGPQSQNYIDKALSHLSQYRSIQDNAAKVLSLQQRIASITAEKGPSDPKVIELNKQIETLQANTRKLNSSITTPIHDDPSLINLFLTAPFR